MNSDLFLRMQYEPCVLMVGKDYTEISKEVYNYRWNMIVTTSSDLRLSAILKNDNRMVQDIFDRQDMKANLLDKRNLHIIRLLGQQDIISNIDELELEDIADNAVVLLKNISEIINRNGIIVIENFEDSIVTHQTLRTALKSLYIAQKQVFIFNYAKEDRYISDLVKQGIATVYSESISVYFRENFVDYEDEYEEDTDSEIQFYIDNSKTKSATSINKRELLETESLATLLNVKLLNEVRISKGMYKDYFYSFLKNSVREPQWYGYQYGFNLHRSYEALLHKKTMKGLEAVGNPNNKPLLVVGQTGTGKSIAIAALAYRIFNEKKYPVVFINDPDINFYSNVEYRQKEIIKKGSQAFNALDNLLAKLEDKGAKATLVIWDASSYSAGRMKCLRLYKALLSRGRKIYMVCTSYKTNELIDYDTDLDEELVLEDSMLNRKFVECYAEVKISDEVGQLKDILLKKCNMQGEYLEKIIDSYACQNSNFLAMFYELFDILRSDLSKGVFKEANLNLQEIENIMDTNFISETNYNVFTLALKKAESELINAGIVDYIKSEEELDKCKIDVAIGEFIKCLAVCSKFKLKMPYDFALRILKTYNPKIIKTLTRSTFFLITQDYYGNYEVSIRTPLEATMYLQAKGISPIEEIDCIKLMLKNMKTDGEYGQQTEVRLCEKLIRIIGPNSKENKKNYKSGYEVIIEELKELRTNRNIWEPILVSQEITYIREYYGRNTELDCMERIEWLLEAVGIAEKMISRSKLTGISAGTRNAIIVESANSKLLLCQLKKSSDSHLYKELKRDLKEVIRYDNQDYHAYVTLLKGSIVEYDNELDEVKKVELLETMCSVADEIIFGNTDISDSEYFQGQVTEIYSRLVDTNILNSYVDELISNGSAAGVYVLARKKLFDCDVDFKVEVNKERQIRACEYVYKMLNEPKNIQVVIKSESCQYMLLNVLWLLNNRKPIYQSGECWRTYIKREVWGEILNLCSNYIVNFCTNVGSVYNVDKNMRYIQALCFAQLGQYSDCVAALKTIEEDSSIGLERVFTKHMICDESGSPLKFTGRLGKYNEIKRSGVVYIDEFGRNPLYYFGPHLKTSNFEEGIVFNDLEVGLSNIAPKVYRNLEIKGDSNG